MDMGALPNMITALTVLALTGSAGAQLSCNTNILDPGTRQYILNFHNGWRTAVALGAAYPAPGGQNIYALTYDCSLEHSAQVIANKCSRVNSNPSERMNRGENFYVYTGSPVKVAAFKHAYVTWRNPAGWTPGQNVFTTTLNTSSLRNFAQMVWGSTTHVGCGYKHCDTFQSVVCHYMTAGAIVDQTVYTIGRGCRGTQDCTTFASSTCDLGRRLCVAPTGVGLPTGAPSGATTAAPAQSTCPDVPSILTPAIRTDIILKRHNKLRSDLVMGRLINGVTRRGSHKMFEMRYDCGLEKQANAFADSNSACQSDAELSVPKAGRNVYVSNETFVSAGDVMNKAISAWRSQIVNFSEGNDLGSAQNELAKMGDFAQVVYWKTTAVGCSIGKCNETRTVVVCRYRVPRPSRGKLYLPTSFRGCIDARCKEAYSNATCNKESGLCQLA